MANVTVDAAADIAIGARVVIRDSNDFVYVLVNAGGNIRAYKGNIAGEPGSFAEQDAVGAPNSADLVGIAAAIDSAGLIHVMYYFDDTVAMQAAPNIRYAQFRTSAHPTTQDDWVLINEEISAMTNSDGDFSFTHLLGIAIDANDDPHATWSDEITDMGSDLETIFYDNRIGGTWGGRIEVERQTLATNQATSLDLMIADPASSVNADRPIIILTNISDSAVNVFHGTTLNATAFTKASDVTGAIIPSLIIQRGKISIAIDSNEKITVTFIENTSNDLMIVEHLNSSVWGTWETPVDVDTTQDYGHPSIAIDGTNRYIFVEHVNDNDIHLWKDVGAGFVEETADADLPNVGTFADVKVKYSTKNNNSPRELDYVFESSGGAVLYNTFQGAAVAAPIIQIANEILEHVDSGLSIKGLVKIADEILNHHFPSGVSDADLKCHYTLDELSGNMINISQSSAKVANSDLVVTGATRGVPGKINNALSFDGANDEAQAGGSAADWAFMSNDGGVFTIIFWCKRDNFDLNVFVLGTTAANDALKPGFKVRHVSSGRRIGMLTGTFGTDRISIGTNDFNYPDDTVNFHMIMLQWSDATGNFRLSIDNQINESKTLQNLTNTDTPVEPLKLGEDTDEQEDYAGDLDELLIFNRYLSDAEITKIFNEGTAKRTFYSEPLAIVTFTKIADEVKEIVELAAIPVLALVRIGSDILDHIETAISKVELRRIADEFLDHIETAISKVELRRIADEILDHIETPVKILGFAKIGSDILDHVESAIKVLGVVKIGSDILDHIETAISKVELRRIADEILEHVESTLALVVGPIVKIAGEILDHIEFALSVKGIVRIGNEILDHIETAISKITVAAAGLLGRRSMDKPRSMDKG